MVKKNNKEITLHDVFDSVNRSFDKIEVRFIGIEDRFGKIEEKLEDLNTSVKAMRGDILNINDRFVTLHKFDELASRVTKLEKGKK